MTEERWQDLYFKFVNETDHSILGQEIREIESALQERLGEIDFEKDVEEYPLLLRTIESVKRLKIQNLRQTHSSMTQISRSEPFRTTCATLIDLDHKYVEVSDDFCRLVGYTRRELIGMKYDELTAPNTNNIEAVFRMFKELGRMQGLWMLVHREGTHILVRYESHLREDSLIEGKLEPLSVGYTTKSIGGITVCPM